MRRLLRVRYLVLFIVCLMYFISYIDRVNISIAGPLIRTEIHLSPTELGLIFSAFAYPYAAMQILGGFLADRLGPRLILGGLSVVWAVATIMTGLSWGVTSLVVFRVLVGVGEGGAFPTATRAFTSWMPVPERGFAQGITHSFARLGGAITPPIVMMIALWRGWRASFVLLGTVSFAWTLVWLAIFRNTPVEHKWVKPFELAEIGFHDSPAGKQDPGKVPWGSLLRRMWLVTLVDFCYGWSLWVFLTWLPSYLSDARGFKLKQMALMTMLPLMAGVVGDTAGGVATDFLLRRTHNIRFARRAVLIVGLSGALAFILPAIFTASPAHAVTYLSSSFFFLELSNAVLWTLPIDIAGRFAGTAGGFMNTGFGVAGMISPVVFGFLIQRTGSYKLPFVISAALLLAGALCSLRIDPTRQIDDSLASGGT
jgi:sugar phosphate permease